MLQMLSKMYDDCANVCLRRAETADWKIIDPNTNDQLQIDRFSTPSVYSVLYFCQSFNSMTDYRQILIHSNDIAQNIILTALVKVMMITITNACYSSGLSG